jgi:two-component system NarL family sensor kinase
MWILASHLQRRLSRTQLESLLLQRTDALKTLTQRLLKVQDDERRRVARDLHDTVGQTMAALKMALADLEVRIRANQPTDGVICDLGALADQALQEIRTTSYLLHPPMLDEIGFTAAAQWYVEGFGQRSGIKATFEYIRGEERLPIAIEMALFRVLQESLTNVHRYSGSPEVGVCFRHQNEMVVLEIADRGCGIPAELLVRLGEGGSVTGVGLAGIRERLEELNGTLEINSSVLGTSLRAVVPLAAKDRISTCRNYKSIAILTANESLARSAQL